MWIDEQAGLAMTSSFLILRLEEVLLVCLIFYVDNSSLEKFPFFMQVYMNLQQEVSPSPQVPFGSLHVCFHQLIPATADRLLKMSMELKILMVAHEGMDPRSSPWRSWRIGDEVYPWCIEGEGGVLWIVAKGVAEMMFPLCFCSCYTADLLTERELLLCEDRWKMARLTFRCDTRMSVLVMFDLETKVEVQEF
jgi:hypothetical protein